MSPASDSPNSEEWVTVGRRKSPRGASRPTPSPDPQDIAAAAKKRKMGPSPTKKLPKRRASLSKPMYKDGRCCNCNNSSQCLTNRCRCKAAGKTCTDCDCPKCKNRLYTIEAAKSPKNPPPSSYSEAVQRKAAPPDEAKKPEETDVKPKPKRNKPQRKLRRQTSLILENESFDFKNKDDSQFVRSRNQQPPPLP